ncbi:hypothetical protein JCM15519_13290 [Fundidesulfovibrio butyratiphilus]
MNGSDTPRARKAPTNAATLERLRQILALRHLLEPEIAALAASNATDQDIRRIRTIYDRQAESAQRGEDAAEDDAHFHLALARASKNEVFREVVAVLYDMLAETRAEGLRSPERDRLSLAGHEAVVAALEKRDPQACRQAMDSHLKSLETRLLSHS